MIRTVSKMLHDSIAHALSIARRPSTTRSSSAAGSAAADTDTFVGMYVNQLTLDYGPRGRAGLERFFGEAYEKKLIPKARSGRYLHDRPRARVALR